MPDHPKKVFHQGSKGQQAAIQGLWHKEIVSSKTPIINHQKLKEMTTEQMMRALFDIYYRECPNRRIEYTAEETNQCWIVMHGIELSYMEYQGQMQPIFMCGRLDDVYYFNTYKECERVWHMTDEEVLAYKKYLEEPIIHHKNKIT